MRFVRHVACTGQNKKEEKRIKTRRKEMYPKFQSSDIKKEISLVDLGVDEMKLLKSSRNMTRGKGMISDG
jgi:hypothetical protein